MAITVEIVGQDRDIDGSLTPDAAPVNEYKFRATGLGSGGSGQVIISRTDGPQQDVKNFTADAQGAVDTQEVIGAAPVRTAFANFGYYFSSIVDTPEIGQGPKTEFFGAAVDTAVITISASNPPDA